MAIQVGIIGPGDVARLHVDALRAAGARVTAVAGLTQGSAEEFAARHEIPSAIVGADALLCRKDVDAVVIATPSPMHAAQSLAALEAGKHVLCEIPVGMSAVESLQVAEKCRRTGLSVMVAHTLRFADPWLRLRAEIAHGRITVRHIILRRTMMRRANKNWSGRPRSWYDSIVWHHGAHQVDLALWLLQGDCPDASQVTVSGLVGPLWEGNNQPMDLGATLRVADRGLVSLSLSYHSSVPVEDALIIADEATFTVYGGKILKAVDCTTVAPASFDVGGTPADARPGDLEVAETDRMKFSALQAQDAEFVAAVREGRMPRSSVQDVQATMQILERLAGT
ncbi:Gfo/Idh/MocA family protein [Paenarthrobacter nicotinovorans]|uniref:Gfo/Idh/MocA family protein n=1 Tax=Paenarthrobacter nicotinovorans TaxID=29320 RepID=UPI003D6736DB